MTDQTSIDVPGGASGAARGDPQRDLADAVMRVFRLGGQWYFSTREGDIGPFRTREQAKREAFAHESVLNPER